jgi:PhoPQ-activated pathogenicity-related protein/PKD repeat protein
MKMTLVGLVLGCVVLAGCPAPTSPNPVPNFKASALGGNVPFPVQFTDTSQPGNTPIRAWAWEFGDGTRSTKRNPQKTYTFAGTFTVSLTITSSQGNFTRTAEKLIQVKDPTTFGALDATGGSVTANGVTISVPPGVLTRETAFGVNENAKDVTLPATENTVRVSRTYSINHDNDSPNLFTTGTDGKVVPTTVRVPILSGGFTPNANQEGQIFLLAQFENGRTLPIPAQFDTDAVLAKVMRLPAKATYTVIYRPESTTFRASDYAKGAKDTPDALHTWPATWKVSASVELVRQLTALRLGNINNEFSFGQRNFTDEQLAETGVGMLIGVQTIHDELAVGDARHPALIEEDDAYTLIAHNMQATYPSGYESFSKLVYRDDFFGQIVVDPGQLLAISTHNSAAYVGGGKKDTDIAQVFSIKTAFVEALYSSVSRAYNFPNITTVGDPVMGIPVPADTDDKGNVLPVHFLAGLEKGGPTYLGQQSDGRLARSLEDSEFALLSLPLLYPYSTVLPNYAQSGQEFYFYLGNDSERYTAPLTLIGSSLEGLRIALDKQPNGGADLSFPAALGLSYQVMNEVLDKELSSYYWDFARDRAFENSQVSIIRDADNKLTPYTFNADRFSADAVVRRELASPTSEVTVNSADIPSLANIGPLSSRAVELQTSPMTTDVVFTFNAADWLADEDGNSMAVKLYRFGADGVELSQPAGVYGDYEIEDSDADGVNDTLTVHNLRNSTEECGELLFVMAANLSLTDFNTLGLTARAESLLDVPESQVLREYVTACDPSYSYRVRNTIRNAAQGVTAYVLEMTSGVWRGAQEVDQPTWRHFLTIVEPDNASSHTAMLVVSGGSTGSEPSSTEASLLLPFAKDSGSVVALMQAVPNEPLVFLEEGVSRTEDAIIAYSYSKYMDSFEDGATDMTWPLLLPMTRSAVRAMDTVQDYMATKPSGARTVDKYVVVGASKRGWTTWLTAAADPRVTAIVPMVIDVLSMERQMDHQKKAYSSYAFDDPANKIYHGYSSSVQDYVKMNVFQRFGDAPESRSLLSIVDPFTYRDILTMPKLISNSTGDQFFLPDSSKFYFDQMLGDNSLHYAPNTDHSLSGGLDFDRSTLSTIEAFYIAQVRNTNSITADNVVVPKYSWRYEDDAQTGKARIVVTSETAPKSVKLWQAVNPNHRDFRLQTLGAKWTGTALAAVPSTQSKVYSGEVEVPADGAGWRGFFVEMVYAGPDPNLPDVGYTFTTPVRVVPDVYAGQ